jgi:Domain of unknown function (DUF4326)
MSPTRSERDNGGPSASDGWIPAREKQSTAEIVTGNAGRHKTLDKIGEVKRIAQDEGRSERLRQKARDALAEMDRTGVVSGPHRRVMLALRADEASRMSDMSSWSENERALLEKLRQGRTVVVSMRENHANIVRWSEANGLLVPVDRSTEWGNPFEMPHDGDRLTVIRNYAEHYLPFKPSLLSRARELRGKARLSPAGAHLRHATQIFLGIKPKRRLHERRPADQEESAAR